MVTMVLVSIAPFVFSCRFSVDVDGLPSCQDSVLVQLRKMQAKHRAQLAALSTKLKLAQEKVGRYCYTYCVSGKG